MPRPERPVDASEGPTEQFAAALRKLRTDSGNLPYRELANIAHFSKATLSAAASGHRLPTWEVTQAYVLACNGDVREWRARWCETRLELGLPVDDDSQPSGPSEDAELTDREPNEPGGHQRRWAGRGLGVMLVIGLTVAAAWALSSGHSNTTRGSSNSISSPAAPLGRFIGGKEPVRDNNDPKKTGCSYDPAVTTIDRVEVNTPDEHYLGELELRHSPQCMAAWGRFTPNNGMADLKNAKVRIVASRPATNTTGTPYETHFDGQAVFGNILTEQDGCVMISVSVEADNGRASSVSDCKP